MLGLAADKYQGRLGCSDCWLLGQFATALCRSGNFQPQYICMLQMRSEVTPCMRALPCSLVLCNRTIQQLPPTLQL